MGHDARVEAYFNHYYTNCLPYAVDRGDVRLCLETADEVLTSEVFADPRLAGEDEKEILLFPSSEEPTIDPSEREFPSNSTIEPEEITNSGSDEKQVRINLELDESESNETPTESPLQGDNTETTQEITTTSFVETDETVSLDIETTETTKIETVAAENENEPTTHTYDIVTFGINPDGSIFYNDEKSAKPDDKDIATNADIADFISEVEKTTDKQGSIEHTFK